METGIQRPNALEGLGL